MWLQKLRPLIPSYIKDSGELLVLLKNLGPLPPNAKLFTADANSMYTNIDTTHALEVISAWLKSLGDRLPDGFPLGAVIDAMSIVMRNNLFNWGDLHFLQLLGTAMGTSSACMWATAYFGVHETTTLIPTYQLMMPLFRRFIDDIFGIWTGDDESWEQFKRDTNNFGILTWEFEEPSTTINFLDLTITIESNMITTKTYQKALNLYQYIPPSSAHPITMMRGIIYGLMRNYHRQNTKVKDYNKMAKKHFQRHVARGWDPTLIKEYILSADIKIQANNATTQHTIQPTTPPTEQLSNKQRLFIHWDYHPNDITRRHLRRIYNQHCDRVFKTQLGIEQTTIAYSRPKNIKDTITKAKLHQASGKEASKYYLGELS
jgi:hypothetical protein